MTQIRLSSRPDKPHAHELLRQMLLIRRFEEKAAEMYQLGKIRGFLHLYIGEEAVGVGAMQALRPEDSIVTTYRDHGHALARGIPAQSLMAEMYGKATGCSRGRGGSMHFFDVSRRFYGGYAIVGGGLPIAAGIALADKMRGEPQHHGLLLRRRRRRRGRVPRDDEPGRALAPAGPLPLREQPLRDGHGPGRTLSETDIARKAESYRIPSQRSMAWMCSLSKRRRGGRPTRCAAAKGHDCWSCGLTASADTRWPTRSCTARRARSRVEEARPDPMLPGPAPRLGAASPEDVERLEAGVAAEIDDAVQFAEESPREAVEDVAKDVCTE